MTDPHPRLETKPIDPALDGSVAQAAIYWTASGELDVYHGQGFRTLRLEQAQEKLEELRRERAAIVYLD